jgi:hypothetical protein
MSSRKLCGVEKVLANRILSGLEKYGVSGFQYGTRSVHRDKQDIVEIKPLKKRSQQARRTAFRKEQYK